MNESDWAFLQRRIEALWPDNNWTPDLFALLGKRVRGRPRDVVVAAVEETRLRRPGNSPNISAIMSALGAAAERTVASDSLRAAQRRGHQPGDRSFAAWVRHYALPENRATLGPAEQITLGAVRGSCS